MCREHWYKRVVTRNKASFDQKSMQSSVPHIVLVRGEAIEVLSRHSW